MNLYTLYLLQHDTDDLGGLVDWGLSPGVQQAVLGADGQVEPTFAAVADQAPTLRYATRALATHLDVLGVDGLAVSASPLYAWLQRNDALGRRATGNVHTKLTVNYGLLVPRRIRAVHNAPDGAQLDAECLFVWDGTNDPAVVAEAQTLPASADEGAQEAYTIGPVSLNGTELDGVQEITVDFGNAVDVRGEKGQVWPTWTGIRAQAPTVTIRVADVGALADLGLTGQAQGATDSEIFFRRLAPGGTRVTEASAEHLKISMNAGRHHVTDVGARHGAWAEATLVLTALESGGTAPLVVDTAATIAAE